MPNTSTQMAVKGSKLRMQQVANNKELKEKFARLIGESEIDFLSPICIENFVEYKLNQSRLLNKIANSSMPNLAEILRCYDFKWASQQPQWDAIALGMDMLYLVEAKSHIGEMASSLSAKKEGGKDLITNTLTKVFNDDYQGKGNFSLWIDGYYQLANRLAFLSNMRKAGIKVKLVLLNFVNDVTMGKMVTAQDWNKHYEDVFEKMIGTRSTPKDVILVNMEIK